MHMILAYATLRRPTKAEVSPPKMRSGKRILQLKISDRLSNIEIKTHGWDIGPFEIRLSNAERIRPRPYTGEVNIDPHTVNVITQLCNPRRVQELVASVSDQPDIVRPVLASNRKIKDQVRSASRNLQRGLTLVRWVLPAGD